MKLKYCLLVFFLILISCKTRKAMFFEGGGSFIDPVDSSLKKDIRIVHFEHSIGVIFPAAFAEKKFGNSYHDTKMYFTPDTGLVKRLDNEIDYQLCRATELFDERFFGNLAAEVGRDTMSVKVKPELRNVIDKISAQSCLYWQQNFKYYDKQYIGRVVQGGEKIIYIRLIDFRQDPHQLKTFLKTSWIDGWHGWFYSNIQSLEYNVKKNIVTIE